jgi:predicted nuclease of predicted toxin-antitoxin system
MGSRNSAQLENSSRVTAKPIVYVDAMFSWRVANLIRNLGYETVHVTTLGVLKNDDRLIWRLAEQRKAIVFTKDTDFLEFAKNTSTAKLLMYVGYNSKQSRILKELTAIIPAALEKLCKGAMLVRIP